MKNALSIGTSEIGKDFDVLDRFQWPRQSVNCLIGNVEFGSLEGKALISVADD